MKLETVQLILLLSVLSLFISILVSWQNNSGDTNHTEKLIVPILLSVLTCHQTFSDYNLLRNVVFGSVLLLRPKGALSNNQQSNLGQNGMLMRNNFQKEPIISQATNYDRPKSPNNSKMKSLAKTESPRLQFRKKKSKKGISRKEELSNRILEEIEALDPLKCLPKALCSLSVQSLESTVDSQSHDSSQGPTEQKQKNNNVINEYLDLMQTIITMEPRKKRQEKKRQFAKTQLERPPSSASDGDDEGTEDDSEEVNEDNEDESEEEESQEEETKPQGERTSYGSSSSMNKFDKDYHRERHKIHSMLATTENPDEWGNLDDIEHPDTEESPGKPGSRHRLRSSTLKSLHDRHGNRQGDRKPEPVGYSQQYHYMSAPGPPGYGHPGYGPGHHDDLKPVSITSLIFSFVPHWIKKIISMFIPAFTIEYKPWITTPPPPSLFDKDPFFNGFKKRMAEVESREEDRGFHDPNKMGINGRPQSRARSLDDVMVDARERFAGAIEIGETFRDLRKCNAVYSTCPFKHTQIVTMIDVLKKKLIIQDIVDKRIANLANKKETISKKKDEDVTVKQDDSPSILTRRKSSAENSHAFTRDSISFSHDKNFKRKPLVIRNINKILRQGSPTADYEDSLSNKIQHRLTVQMSNNGRDKTANINTQEKQSAEYSDSSEEDLKSPQLKKHSRKSNKPKYDKNKPASKDEGLTLFQSILSLF